MREKRRQKFQGSKNQKTAYIENHLPTSIPIGK